MSTPTFDRWRAQGTDWFVGRSRREQGLLAVLGILAALTLLIVGVWSPLRAARAEALAEIRLADTVTARLRAAGPDIARRVAARSAVPASLPASAARFGLNIRRLDPEGSRTRVVIEDAAYADVIRWLDQLEQSGRYAVSDLKLERRPPPGVVNVQLTLTP